MPRLLLLNGPPAVGKSTLARRYAADRPLSLVLDVDLLRGWLGRWSDDPVEAGELARDRALVLAAAHLTGGRDVVVPQHLARRAFADRLHEVARRTGAQWSEVVLWDELAAVASRFAARAAVDPVAPQDPPEVVAAHWRAHLGTPGRRVAVVAGDVEATYARLLAEL